MMTRPRPRFWLLGRRAKSREGSEVAKEGSEVGRGGGGADSRNAIDFKEDSDVGGTAKADKLKNEPKKSDPFFKNHARIQ